VKRIESTKTSVLSLGAAMMVERLIQFAIPIVLIRFLTPEEYGSFRIFWLLVNTVMLFAPLGLTQSLMFFLPRSDARKKSVFVYQTLLLLLATGLMGALLIGPWSPFFPSGARDTAVDSFIPPLFVVLWTVCLILDLLPSAMRDVKAQVRIVLVLSVFRPFLVLGAAVLTGELKWVLAALVVFVSIKLFLLAYYVIRCFGFRVSSIDIASLREQLEYSLPFGLSAGLYNLRVQAERWVVVLMFNAELFAIFSVGAIFVPMVDLLRRPVRQVIQPIMSQAHANMNIERVVQLNLRGNLVVSFFLLPVLAYLMFFADQIVVVLFTEEYADAASILRIYVLGMMRMAVEVASILIVYSQGRFVMKLAGSLSLLSIGASYLGASYIGLEGAAIGSVSTIFVGAFFNYRRASRLVGLPVKKMQDCKGVFFILFSALISSVLALWAVSVFIENDRVLFQMIAGLAITGVLYLAVISVLGYGWLLKIFWGRGVWDSVEGKGV